MKRLFVIQNAFSKKYWYGFYTNKKWTDDILEAKLFDDVSISNMQEYIENNLEEFDGMYLIIVEMWHC